MQTQRDRSKGRIQNNSIQQQRYPATQRDQRPIREQASPVDARPRGLHHMNKRLQESKFDGDMRDQPTQLRLPERSSRPIGQRIGGGIQRPTGGYEREGELGQRTFKKFDGAYSSQGQQQRFGPRYGGRVQQRV